MPNLSYAAGPDMISAYLAVPEGAGPWPAVVVLHEVWGLNDDIRAQADRFAAQGYLALAPDLYSTGPRLTCIRRALQDSMRGRGRTHTYLQLTRQWLAARQDCTGSVGVIGFCMGGGFALAAAASAGFAAAAVNYGYLPRHMEELLAGACPIVGSYGGRDMTQRNVAAKLDRTLTRLNVIHDVKEYPAAGHGFLTQAPTGPPPLNLLTKHVLHVGHCEEEARDAWERIFTFFDDHVKGGRADQPGQ